VRRPHRDHIERDERLEQHGEDLTAMRADFERAITEAAATPSVAADLRHLSRVLQDAGALVEARLVCQRALIIDTQAFGRTHPVVAVDLRCLGHILWDTGDHYGAEYCFDRAREIESYGLTSDVRSIAPWRRRPRRRTRRFC